MKFSLLYELQREPGDPEYNYKVVHEALEQVTLADQVGFDNVWFVEHHTLEYFSASPWPEGILAAISQRTKKIRLGLGVVVLPYHHPVRVAERVAMLDILSEGRVDFGTGRGSAYEQLAFGLDPRESRGMWEESLKIITQIWATEGEFSYEGKYWQIPTRVMLPKPVQKPHPPIWLASLQPETYGVAADNGLGVLAFSANTADSLKDHIPRYHQACAASTPIGAFANNQWGTFTLMYCDEDNEAARQLCTEATRAFFGPGRPYAAAATQLVKDLLIQWGDNVPDYLRPYLPSPSNGGGSAADVLRGIREGSVQALWDRLDPATLCDGGAIIGGDPAGCIAGIAQHQAVGADHIIMLAQNATIPHEKVMRSLDLFGRKVIPHFRQQEAATAVPLAARS